MSVDWLAGPFAVKLIVMDELLSPQLSTRSATGQSFVTAETLPKVAFHMEKLPAIWLNPFAATSGSPGIGAVTGLPEQKSVPELAHGTDPETVRFQVVR